MDMKSHAGHEGHSHGSGPADAHAHDTSFAVELGKASAAVGADGDALERRAAVSSPSTIDRYA